MAEKGIREKKLRNGKSLWEVRITRKGKPSLSKSFSTFKEANLAKLQYLLNIEEGKLPPNIRAEKYTILDAITEYRTFRTQSPTPIPKNENFRFDTLINDIGHWSVLSLKNKTIAGYFSDKLKEKVPPPKNKIRKDHLPQYKGHIERTYAPATIRLLFYSLKKLATWHSIKHEYDLQRQAFETQEVPGSWDNPRDRRLEEGEEEKILNAIKKSYVNHDEWRCLILWALESGMRAQELLLTEWKHINFKQRYIRLRKEIVKTEKARQIPLSLKAIEVLKEHEKTKSQTTDRIFWQWTDSGSLGKAFKIIVHNAQLEKSFTIHDLRHEATSRLFEKTSLSIAEIAAITGHTDYNTLLRYAHLRAEHMASKLDGKTEQEMVQITLEDYNELINLASKKKKETA